MQFGCSEHEVDVSGRLFEGLEQGIEGFSSQHVDLIDNNDLVFR